MMFSQINTPAPDANHLLQFWLILALISAVLASVASFISVFSNRKQRREVNFAFEPASREAFDEHVRETRDNFNQIRNELKEDRHSNQVHASTRAASLYKRIDDVEKRLSDKVDMMPDRLIVQLRNTKGLID